MHRSVAGMQSSVYARTADKMAPPPGGALPQQRLYELAVRYGELDVANEILNRGKLKEPQAAPERQPLLHVLRAARALRSKPKQRRKQPQRLRLMRSTARYLECWETWSPCICPCLTISRHSRDQMLLLLLLFFPHRTVATLTCLSQQPCPAPAT